jgi:tripartite-type tricarboxylate transporter receptor subunit TctC
MKSFLKKGIRAVAATAMVSAIAAPMAVYAQDNYPNKPIKLVVGFAPGGPTDIVARLIGVEMEKRLGQPIVIDNKAGGGSNIGAAEAARGKPDGYTLFMMTVAQTINPAVYSKLTYNTQKDFEPIALTMSSPSVLVVNPNVPAKTASELVAWAKANPGKLTMASSGAGGSPHMAAELFKLSTGIEYLHVPYKGANPAMNDVLSGVVLGGFKTATAAIPQIKAGKVRALAVAAPQRLAQLPDVPTMAEAGFPDINVTSWNGIVAPAGTPKAIVDKLNAVVNEVLKNPEVVAQFEKRAAVPVGGSPAYFRAFIDRELKTWAGVAKAANVKIN